MIEFVQITAVPTLMHWHMLAVNGVSGGSPDRRELVAYRSYFREHMADGRCVAFVAVADGVDTGFGAMRFDVMPSSDICGDCCAVITDIYVRPEFRHRGIGRAIADRLGDEARSRGCARVSFHPDSGRGL